MVLKSRECLEADKTGFAQQSMAGFCGFGTWERPFVCMCAFVCIQGVGIRKGFCACVAAEFVGVL